MYNSLLETFITAADCGSLSKAAEKLFLSPTAVMKQLNLLENHLNLKLIERSKRIIMMATDCDYQTAEKMYEASGNYPKVAIVMILTGCTKEEAESRLQRSEGFVRQAIQ